MAPVALTWLQSRDGSGKTVAICVAIAMLVTLVGWRSDGWCTTTRTSLSIASGTMKTTPLTPQPLPDHGDVWYVSYGSNMSAVRLAVYLEGGVPPGGNRNNPGARNSAPPRRSVPVDLPGALYFAGRSRQWGGGVAFYDHLADGGPTAARAYLVTAEQFADVAAQEMYRVPQEGDPLEEVVLGGLEGGTHHAGPGRYETLVEVGRLDGAPMLLFTAPNGIDHVEHTQPSSSYLAMLSSGLLECRDWDERDVATYFERLGVRDWPEQSGCGRPRGPG